MQAIYERGGRTIRIVDIPTRHPKDLCELVITINYVSGGRGDAGKRADGSQDYIGDGEKAVPLDGIVIPLLVEAFNNRGQ